MAAAERPALLSTLRVGGGSASREIAVLATPGRTPDVLWLGGFRSDMTGTKAEALALWCEWHGRGVVRFDYSGHGRSSGAFEEGTIGRWLEDAEAVLRHMTHGPTILVGSSMGGWIALLIAMRLARAEPGRIAGLVLIAPAPDFTERLLWSELSPAEQVEIETTGVLHVSSAWSEPYPVTRALIQDGRRHQVLDGPIETGAPVHIIQGLLDEEVPWRHALSIIDQIARDDVVATLVKDGDHRLSRPEDIKRILAAVEEIAQDPAGVALR